MRLIHIPTEQTTAATDAILAVLATWAVLYLRNIGQSDLMKTKIWCGVFGLLAFSAALGAVIHGFQMSPQLRTLLWQPLYLSLGLTVAMFAVAAAYDLWSLGAVKWIGLVMVVAIITMFGAMRVLSGGFLAFVILEGVIMLFALCGYIYLAMQGHRGAGTMAAGILVSLSAAAIQSSESLRFRVIWEFDHNGIFHMVQMIGVVLLVIGLRAALNKGSFHPA
jgi:hypothetical protein